MPIDSWRLQTLLSNLNRCKLDAQEYSILPVYKLMFGCNMQHQQSTIAFLDTDCR